MEIKSIEDFKLRVAPALGNTVVKYRHFEESDFGAQDEVYFELNNYGVEINFWDTGWFGIYIYDMNKGDFYLNRLLEPEQTEEKKGVWPIFLDFLRSLNVGKF